MKLSDYILGLWRMNQWDNTPQENLSLLEQCLELGITSVDQANVYGWQPSCEELFGQALALAPSLRNQIQLISKFNICAHGLPTGHAKHYDTSFENAVQSVDLSLQRMGVDHLDVLLIHRLDYLMNADEVTRAFEQLKIDGKVLEFGVSNFTSSQFSLLQSWLGFPLITNQVELNPLRYLSMEDGTLDQCQQHRIRPMAWSPLAGGELFTSNPTPQCARVIEVLKNIGHEIDASLDQVALAWVQKHPSRPHVILGSQSIERIKSATQSAKISLTHEQWYRVLIASQGHDVP